MKNIILYLVLSVTYLVADAKIFVHHRFGDDLHKSTNVSNKDLRKQFDYLKENNYTVVPMSKIINYINQKKVIPNKWVAFNIDDSYKSFYENGLPIFKEYGYTFSLYVYVEATDKKYSDFMTWEQLKETSKYGEISLHSYGHKHSTHLSNKELLEDTQKAYDIFVKNLGYKPKGFVYPYGEYNQNTKKVLMDNFDFDYIANQNSGSVSHLSDKYDINRIALVGNANIKEKLKYTTMENVEWIEPKYYPKDNILKYIKVKVNKKLKKVQIYVSTYGWKTVKVIDGIAELKFNKKLKLKRTRVIVGTSVFNINTKLLIK